MAKIIVKKTNHNNVMISAEVTSLQTQVQVNDAFYIPNDEHFIVLGTPVDEVRNGEIVKDAEGNPVQRAVGQRIIGVLVVDGAPVEARELYIGQIVKRDINGRVVFPNVLSQALRSNGKKFTDMIQGNLLIVKEEGTCSDRMWDNATNSYKRDENGRFVADPTPKRCFRWEVERPGRIDTAACNKMIADYVKTTFPEIFDVEE